MSSLDRAGARAITITIKQGPLVIATSLLQLLMAGAGGCIVVPGSWWQLSSPLDNAWFVVNVIDAEGCPGFVSDGICVMVVCAYLMVSMTSARHGMSLLVLLNAKAC